VSRAESAEEPQVNYDAGSKAEAPPVPTEPQADSSEPYQARAGRASVRTVGRGGDGKFRTKTDQIERDAQASALYDQGWTYKRIAAELGMSNQGRAHDAVMRHLKRIPVADVESIRRQMEQRLSEMRRIALAVAGKDHIAHGQGRAVEIEDPDNPGTYIKVHDDGPKLQALDRLLRIEERRAKLYGADMPTRTEFSGSVEVGVELIGIQTDDV
jgi:hypothetical protein